MPNYTALLAEFRAELDRLLAQRDQINIQIGALVTAMESIQILAKDSGLPIMAPPPMPPDAEAGFTEKIRAVLKNNPLRATTAVELRDYFVETMPNADPKVLLIHIHNTLKRLHKQGELEEIDSPENRTAYKVKFPGVDILSLLANATPDTMSPNITVTNAFRERLAKANLSPPPGGSILNAEEQHQAAQETRKRQK